MVECTENSRDSKVLSDRLPATEFNKGLFLFLGILSGFLIYLASGYILSVLPKTLYLFYNCAIGLSIGVAVSLGLSKGEYINKKMLFIIAFLASLVPFSMFILMNNMDSDFNHYWALYLGKEILEGWLSNLPLPVAIGAGFLLFRKQKKWFHKKNIFLLIITILFFLYVIRNVDSYDPVWSCRILLMGFVTGIFISRLSDIYANKKVLFIFTILYFLAGYFLKIWSHYILSIWLFSMLIVISIFLWRNRVLSKNIFFVLAGLSSLTVFFTVFFAMKYYGIVFDFFYFFDGYCYRYGFLFVIYILIYVFYLCFVSPFFIYFLSRKGKINMENIFSFILVSSFLIYIFFTFFLYIIFYINVPDYKKEFGFFPLVRYVNESLIDKPLTLADETRCMCEEGKDKNNIAVTTYLVDFYNKVTLGILGDSLVLINIQLWVLGFFLTVFCAWLFILLANPQLFFYSKYESNKSVYSFLRGRGGRKIAITFLFIFIVFAVTISQSIFMEHVERINRACSSGNLPEVERLLKINPYLINFGDRVNLLPIQSAVLNNKKDVAEFLVSKGANLNLDSYSSYRCFGTPLYMAADNGLAEMVEFLLLNGADVNRKNRYNGTPLHAAAEKGYLEIVEMLLSAGADVNVKNKSWTYNDNREYVLVDNKAPLHCAIESHSIEIVKLLLDNGAEVNWKDFSGETPLDFAINGKYDPKIINLLKEHGAKKGSKL